jgi:hypothetical protein
MHLNKNRTEYVRRVCMLTARPTYSSSALHTSRPIVPGQCTRVHLPGTLPEMVLRQWCRAGSGLSTLISGLLLVKSLASSKELVDIVEHICPL